MKTIPFEPKEYNIEELEANFTEEFKEVRSHYRISQKKLGALSNIAQPVIARIEIGNAHPRISTLIKLLAPLGKTIKIVNIEEPHE